jgi:predicted cytidylate kinase
MSNLNNLPKELPGIRNIAISGRIGTGKSTLASHLADELSWNLIDAGKVFRQIAKEIGFDIKQTEKIPEEADRSYEEKTLALFKNEKNNIVQSHLAGYLSKDLKDVFKILVVCDDEEGEDKVLIRIDRLMNRDIISAEEAKSDIYKREESLINKFRRLYIKDDPNWVYWDKKYFDLIVNTYVLNQKEAVTFVLEQLRNRV